MSSYSNLHDTTNFFNEIPEVGVQPPGWQVKTALVSMTVFAGVGETAASSDPTLSDLKVLAEGG